MSDRRGQSTVLGFIFVIAIVVALIGLNQAVLVPNANEEVEFKHSQKIQDDMVNLRNNVQQAASSDDDQTTSLNLGPRYPQRFLAVNPGDPAGTLRHINASDPIEVANVQASDQETADFWDGTLTAEYQTGRIVYEPSYNLYADGQTHVLENTLLYSNPPAGETIVRTEQSVINGKRINLVALNGSYFESTTSTVQTEIEPLSVSSNRIAVRNQSSTEQISITLRTNLSESEWVNTVLADELDEKTASPSTCGGYTNTTFDPDDGRYVVNCLYSAGSGQFNQIQLILQPDVTYSLKMSKLGIGSQTAETDREYITVVGPSQFAVEETGTKTFTVEVRDEFNNPVSGVKVNVSTRLDSSNSTIAPTENDNLTDDDGRVTFVYESNQTVDSIPVLEDTINVSYDLSTNLDDDSFDAEDSDSANLTTGIRNTDKSGLLNGTLINPAGAGAVPITDVSFTPPDKVEVEFTNNGGEEANWDEARVAFIDGSQNSNAGKGFELNNDPADELVALDPFEQVDSGVSISAGGSETVLFTELTSTNINGNFFVVEVQYEDKPGVTQYFIYVSNKKKTS